MKKTSFAFGILLLASALPGLAFGQEMAKAADTDKAAEPTAHYYRLDFVVQEVGADGKPTNSRSYSTTVGTAKSEQWSAIRTGSKIPVITSEYQGPNGEPKNNLQYQYIDVGVNIDTSAVHEVGRLLSLSLKAEVSTVAGATPQVAKELASQPVIRQNMWQAAVLIPVGKQSLVFSSDALENKGGMQLLVTATPLQ